LTKVLIRNQQVNGSNPFSGSVKNQVFASGFLRFFTTSDLRGECAKAPQHEEPIAVCPSGLRLTR
jgi:hypothetical protein